MVEGEREQQLENFCLNTLAHDAHFQINRQLIKAIGFLEAGTMGMLLGYYKYYRENDQLQEDGSFYFTIDRFQEEMNISDYQRREILDFLKKISLLTVLVRNFPPKTYYKINFQELKRYLEDNTLKIQRKKFMKSLHFVDLQQNDHSVEGQQNEREQKKPSKYSNLSKVNKMTPFCRRSTDHSVEGQQNESEGLPLEPQANSSDLHFVEGQQQIIIDHNKNRSNKNRSNKNRKIPPFLIFGEFQNVRLTQEQFMKLGPDGRNSQGRPYITMKSREDWIETVSEAKDKGWLPRNRKKNEEYSDFSTILSWDRSAREKAKGNGTLSISHYETNDDRNQRILDIFEQRHSQPPQEAML